MIDIIALWIGYIVIGLGATAGLLVGLFLLLEIIIKYSGYNKQVLKAVWSIYKSNSSTPSSTREARNE